MDEHIHILIVEDEETILQSLYRIISRRYKYVYFAENAQKALMLFQKEKIDLVLTDIRMPGMDGITMLRKMKLMKPNLRRLVMSAYTESEYFLEAIDLGVDGYIVKPYLKEKILEGIESSVKSIYNERIADQSTRQLAFSAKELKEMNESKDRFFSIIGHDVKTPVSTIASYSNLLVEEFDDMEKEEVLQMLKIIRKSSFRALDLLKNLLEWAKVQTGSIAFDPEILDICDVIKEEVDFASHLWGKKKIGVKFSPKTNSFVYADRNMVRTVFRNLLSNAIKFTPEQGEIQLFSERNKEHTDLIKISIRDTGVGISKKVLPKLFTLNDNFSTAGTSGEVGSGMGLLFCKEFIDIQGGTIFAESTIGEGSTFSFTLPVAELGRNPEV